MPRIDGRLKLIQVSGFDVKNKDHVQQLLVEGIAGFVEIIHHEVETDEFILSNTDLHLPPEDVSKVLDLLRRKSKGEQVNDDLELSWGVNVWLE